MLTPDDLAAGAAALHLGEDGVPVEPLVVVDLTRPVDEAIWARAAEQVRASARAVVGVCPGDVPAAASELARACMVVLTHEEQGPWTVAVPDLEAAAAGLVRAAQHTPRATAVVGPLLALTSALPTPEGLVAESLAYSMLLAGPEFATWRASRPARPPRAYDDEPVLLRRDNDLLVVTLNRPARHNAYSREVRDALAEALAVAAADPALEVLMQGNGASFCSGGDLDEFGATADATVAHHVRLARSVGLLLHGLRNRSTAVVHGACIGAGVELPAFAGRVLARPDARFRLPELAMGLVPGAGGTVSVTRRVGRWRTAWMVLSGVAIDVPTARRWGLVDGLV